MGKMKLHTKFWWGNLKKETTWRPRRRREDNIERDLQEINAGALTELVCLRIGTSGGLLWMRYWTFGFHKMRAISWIAEDLLVFKGSLCCKQLVSYLVS
jgi:hypothetical protein